MVPIFRLLHVPSARDESWGPTATCSAVCLPSHDSNGKARVAAADGWPSLKGVVETRQGGIDSSGKWAASAGSVPLGRGAAKALGDPGWCDGAERTCGWMGGWGVARAVRLRLGMTSALQPGFLGAGILGLETASAV